MGKTNRSWTAKKKLNVVDYAERFGNRAAGRHFKIGESNIRNWRKQSEKLEVLPATKRADRGKPAAHPDMERDLYQWIWEQRIADKTVSSTDIRVRASYLLRTKYPDTTFKASLNWCYLFMKRHKLIVKRRTGVELQPDNYEEKLTQFETLMNSLYQSENGTSSEADQKSLTVDIPKETKVTDADSKRKPTKAEKNKPTKAEKSVPVEAEKNRFTDKMVKRSSASNSRSASRRNSARAVGIQLMMDCQNEDLSPAQMQYMKKCRLEYDNAMAMIKAAQAKARAGKATVSIQKVHNKNISPLKAAAAAPKQAVAQPRSSSPDVIIVGESPPPPALKAAPPTSAAVVPKVTAPPPNAPQQYVIRSTIGSPLPGQTLMNKQAPALLRLVPVNNMNQLRQQRPAYPVQLQPPRQNFLLQGQHRAAQNPNMSATSLLVSSAMMAKRHMEGAQDNSGPAKKKVKKAPETDGVGSWVPLDEYYYGKMEGDPSYTEEKGEYRFKCWYCSKMLYNNIKAMMHIQGHIDSGKQHNLDLSDLTQCKHCYKQFDTPFEMQTHVEKVHMNGANVLLCRICERDHESRNALTHHMRQNHTACEMPYICHLCNFRSSMYSDVVDHFKKKHDSSQHILCLYCLKVFKLKFVSMGWGQTQTYYGHLLKHQSKASTKKCTVCRLTFYNQHDVKAHKKKDHLPNHKGVLGANNRYSTPGQVMIKIPESGLQPKQQSVKSLNAPAVSKVLDFGGTRFPTLVNYLTCLECKMSMGTPDHFKKYIECSMCRFATSCSIAYANHMMGFHSCQVSSLNLNIPWERRMESPMYCLCGFGSRYGNKIANHLVYCTKRTCYLAKPDLPTVEEGHDDDTDPRRKPGASILDVLGLVKKRTVATKVIRRPSREELQESRKISPATEDPPAEAAPQGSTAEEIPPELTGSQKWTTVKIKEPEKPSKASVFLGVDDIKKDNDDEDEDKDMDISLPEEMKNSLQQIVDDDIKANIETENLKDQELQDVDRKTKDVDSADVDMDSISGSGDNVPVSCESENLPVAGENEGLPAAGESESLLVSKNVPCESGEFSEASQTKETKMDTQENQLEGTSQNITEEGDVSEEIEEKKESCDVHKENDDIEDLDDNEIDKLLKDESESADDNKSEKVQQSEERTLLSESPEDGIENRKSPLEQVEPEEKNEDQTHYAEDEGSQLKSNEEEDQKFSSETAQSPVTSVDSSQDTSACDTSSSDYVRVANESEQDDEKVSPEKTESNKAENVESDMIESEANNEIVQSPDRETTTKDMETQEEQSSENIGEVISPEKGDKVISAEKNEDDTKDRSGSPHEESSSSANDGHKQQDTELEKGGNSGQESRRQDSEKGHGSRQHHSSHSRDRDRSDDRSRDSRHDDWSSKSDYRDSRSQGSHRSHDKYHHDDRSYDRDRGHSRSYKDDRNRGYSDNRNYHGNQDNRNYHGGRDNRNYHGNHPYSRDGRDDRRYGGYHDKYQSNRNQSNYRGRGGYGNQGGYQGNYR